MTPKQIHQLLTEGCFPKTADSGSKDECSLLETHISWVILCDQFAYKIKKPLHYSFLDFSTLEQRRYYCDRELALNKRFAPDIYLDVQPVCLKQEKLVVGDTGGDIIDYAVRMQKMDQDQQMDVLLRNNKVTLQDMERLAEVIATFHQSAEVIRQKDYMDIKGLFGDLKSEQNYLSAQLQGDTDQRITRALAVSESFMAAHTDLLEGRLREGLFRDCHGDLHTRNIFLLPAPQPFDCIEFNDDFRRIDVLNEVAFLCMDLDALGRADLGEHFLRRYNHDSSAMRTQEEEKLFIYYKSYRANIRAKVNSLRARNAEDSEKKTQALSAARQYLQLMDGYIELLNTGGGLE